VVCNVKVARSNIARRNITSKGDTESKDKDVGQTDAERRFKLKPYLSCDLRFSTRLICEQLYKAPMNDCVFSPLRWVRRRPFLPLSRFVMSDVW